MSGGGSSCVVKSRIKVARGTVAVDGEEDRGGGSLGSVESLSDQQWLSGGGDAVSLEVNVADSVKGSGPRAGNINSSGGGVDSLSAGEVLDVSGWVFLGVSWIGDELNSGRVG